MSNLEDIIVEKVNLFIFPEISFKMKVKRSFTGEKIHCFPKSQEAIANSTGF